MLIQQATLCWFLWRILAIQHHWFPKIIKCSNEGLTLETSASETHYDGQFTLPTQLVKPNYFVIPHQSFFRNLPRWFMLFIETMHGEISHGKSYGRCCAFCFCPVTFKSCHVSCFYDSNKMKGDQPNFSNHCYLKSWQSSSSVTNRLVFTHVLQISKLII